MKCAPPARARAEACLHAVRRAAGFAALTLFTASGLAGAARADAPPSTSLPASAALPGVIPAALVVQDADAAYQRLLRAAARRKRLLSDDQVQVKRVRTIAQKLEPAAVKWNEQTRRWHWEVNVVRATTAHVYCLPDGKLLVTSGMLDRMHLNDDELGVLLAHEIAHALRDHARARLGKLGSGATPRAGLTAFGTYRLPDIDVPLPVLHYGRADETEADVIGADIAARAGFDPRAALTLWTKLNANRRGATRDFMREHPFNRQRADDLKNRLPDMLQLYAKAIGKAPNALPAYSLHGGRGR